MGKGKKIGKVSRTKGYLAYVEGDGTVKEFKPTRRKKKR